MIPLSIKGADHRMVAPNGEPDIRPLNVRVIDGCFVSRCKPTAEDLAMLNAGRSVELWVKGGQPPVNLVCVPHAGGDL